MDFRRLRTDGGPSGPFRHAFFYVFTYRSKTENGLGCWIHVSRSGQGIRPLFRHVKGAGGKHSVSWGAKGKDFTGVEGEGRSDSTKRRGTPLELVVADELVACITSFSSYLISNWSLSFSSRDGFGTKKGEFLSLFLFGLGRGTDDPLLWTSSLLWVWKSLLKFFEPPFQSCLPFVWSWKVKFSQMGHSKSIPSCSPAPSRVAYQPASSTLPCLFMPKCRREYGTKKARLDLSDSSSSL